MANSMVKLDKNHDNLHKTVTILEQTKTLPLVLSCLESKDPRVRTECCNVMQGLARSDSKEFVASLVQAVPLIVGCICAPKDPKLVELAVMALGALEELKIQASELGSTEILEQYAKSDLPCSGKFAEFLSGKAEKTKDLVQAVAAMDLDQ